MIERTTCEGRTVEGQPCRAVRLRVEPPWFCHHHRAQDGKKRLVSAVVPLWAVPEEAWPEETDIIYPEWTF